jgi:hypothetical protein
MMQSSDLEELKQLVGALKADHAAQKEKEAKERWTRHVSLSMICLAVLTALATLKGGGFTTRTLKEMNEGTFNQAQASDQWAYYQAKSIKQSLYEVELDQLKTAGNAAPATLAKTEGKLAKYEQEKSALKKEAEKFESVRDTARRTAVSAAEHSKEMGLSITIFQISIAMGGVCLIVKKKPLWFVSLALGLFATCQMIRVLEFMPF